MERKNIFVRGKIVSFLIVFGERIQEIAEINESHFT